MQARAMTRDMFFFLLPALFAWWLVGYLWEIIPLYLMAVFPNSLVIALIFLIFLAIDYYILAAITHATYAYGLNGHFPEIKKVLYSRPTIMIAIWWLFAMLIGIEFAIIEQQVWLVLGGNSPSLTALVSLLTEPLSAVGDGPILPYPKGVIANLILLYLMIRFALFFPRYIETNHVGLKENWQLTKGNVFGILKAHILVLIPEFLIMAVIIFAAWAALFGLGVPLWIRNIYVFGAVVFSSTYFFLAYCFLESKLYVLKSHTQNEALD